MAQEEYLNPAFRTMYSAAQKRLEDEAARSRALSLRSAASKGLTTSGVSELPLGEIERGKELGLASTYAGLAGTQQGQEFQKQQAELEFKRQLQLMDLQNAAQRKLAKSQMTGQIIGGGIGAIGSILAR